MESPNIDRPRVRDAAKRMKGIGFANLQAFVQENHGDAAWTRVRAAMSGDDRAELDAIVAVGWYDVYLFARLIRTIDCVLGTGDLRLARRLGAFEAMRDFNRVYRVLLRILSPEQIFKAERRLWSHFQDSGVWTTESIPNGMRCTLAGWAVDEALCQELSGYIERLIEFTGGRNVRGTHPECRARHAARCVHEFRWGRAEDGA